MSTQKRLTRSRDKKIAGVCGGVATYMDIDPTIVRILFLIVAFAGGAAILAYLIIWIVTPEESAV